MHLAYDIARPALNIIVLHGAVPTGSDHVHGIAVVDELVFKKFSVSVSVIGQNTVRDGGPQGHDTEPQAVLESARGSTRVQGIIILSDWACNTDTCTGKML